MHHRNGHYPSLEASLAFRSSPSPSKPPGNTPTIAVVIQVNSILVLHRTRTFLLTSDLESFVNFSCSRIYVFAMAEFRPAQEQSQHPGEEHLMDPVPRHHGTNYKAAGKLKGKIALVTGGDSGIGRAVGVLFTREGATVAFTYVKGAEEKDAVDTINLLKQYKAEGGGEGEPLAIPCDLGFDEQCKKVVDKVVEKYGRIDILVNNAAEQHVVENIEDLQPEQLERTFRTNIFSQFYLVRHALKHMKEGSCIINTTSVNAFKGNTTLLDYTSTKGAILAFTRGLALQLVKRGIRVNAVAPGPIWTPLIPASMGQGSPEKMKSFGSQCPMGRAGEPEEIATAYVFLASEDSSYFTGQTLHPNGGIVVNA
ncbi:NADPH-dependent aldehyde reductase 1, chloroplastic [Physcomitrium patens]|uniref:Uncharacterized protein n=2 Tax=Physcomitrium patens TaxID=3218 RepID=A0A2K1ICU5_PHYPA|nr:NADPH-dependent aldehyde reductase 1, chloroplastic-like [Physcomitrium patens]PNR27103.1 hypothetical protein PHYPA_030584 [Physcomitrium patens]|eukprot:XP_024366286.1 NADPH-dependent aldehyde reductase 1, chloroplastic-like [Physcomitrella patens]